MAAMTGITIQTEANGDVVAYRNNGRLSLLCYGHQEGKARDDAIARSAMMLGIRLQQKCAQEAIEHIIMGR